MKVQELLLTNIKVKKRFRVEMGEIDDLAASIREKGLLQPITVDTNDNLLAGGRRLAAARKAGLRSVNAVIRKVDGELDAREIELHENIYRKDLAWNERALLEQRIFDLLKKKDPNWSQRKQAQERDVSNQEISRRIQLAGALEALPELAQCKTQDEAWKRFKRIEEDVVLHLMEKKAPKGVEKFAVDHYQIGDAVAGLEGVANGVVGFADVDPPYAVELDRRKKRNKAKHMMDQYNEVSADEYPSLIANAAREVYRILRDNSFCVWWFGTTWYTETLAALREAEFAVFDVPALWYKGQVGQTTSPDTMLAQSYETFFVARKGLPKLRKTGRSNVFHFSPISPAKKIHPTEKPLDLMCEMLDTFAYPGMVICAPFLGSGSVLRAAYKRGMNGFGWDLDPIYKKRFLGRVREDILGIEEADSGDDN